ncbi:uncharacterized transporter slc-17.2-like [Liolophura sinensis]|uniref:uncharacterized transporter slc-17.2-like n=1 Tax=Liolophura sinensis TaxID=3198878 RepID=UPI003157F2C9
MDECTETVMEERQEKETKCNLRDAISRRYQICFISMTGCMFVLAMRANLGFAIVCMVIPSNATSLIREPNLSQYSPWIGNDSAFVPINFSIVENYRMCGSEAMSAKSLIGQGGEFTWDRSLQSKLLASFYFGYIVTQIPGGWLARRYGSRDVIGYSFILLVVATILFPVASRAHTYLSFALRVVAGLASGMVFPAMSCLWGRWAPPLERSKLFAIQQLGTFRHSSWQRTGPIHLRILCDYGFDNGWGSIFYVIGLCGLAWVVSWFLVVHDSPSRHPKISDQERQFIERAIGDREAAWSKDVKTPWRKLLTSSAVWAGVVAHTGTNWTVATLLTGLPTYMKEVLAFDIKQNGVLSAVPALCGVSAIPLIGYSADALQERNLLSTQNTRRLFESISGIGGALFMMLTGFVTCENRLLAVVYLSLGTVCLDAVKAGQGPNSLDIAPRFSGEIWGLSNTVATMPGMIAPIVNGVLTPNGTQEEWQTVFYLCAGFSLLKTVVFVIFVKGHVLPWATGNVSVGTEIASPMLTEVALRTSVVTA